MDSDDDGSEEIDPDKVGYLSCVTKFIRMLLSLMEHGAKTHLKHLTEYFALLLEFSKMGEEECQFLISIHAISTMVNFYLGQKSHEYVSINYITFCTTSYLSLFVMYIYLSSMHVDTQLTQIQYMYSFSSGSVKHFLESRNIELLVFKSVLG